MSSIADLPDLTPDNYPRLADEHDPAIDRLHADRSLACSRCGNRCELSEDLCPDCVELERREQDAEFYKRHEQDTYFYHRNGGCL